MPPLLLLFALATQPAPATAATLDGVVLDQQRRPIAGAEVMLFREVDFTFRPHVAAQTSADPKGRFSLKLPDRLSAGIGGPRLTLIATAPGFTLSGQDISGELLIAGEPLTLTLQKSLSQSLTILDRAGRAVPGAEVVPVTLRFSGGTMRVAPQLAERLATKTDEQGRVKSDSFSFDNVYRWRITTNDYGTQEFQFPYRSEQLLDWKTISLATAGRIKGRINGAPPEVLRDMAIFLFLYPEGEIEGDAKTPRLVSLWDAPKIQPKEDGSFETGPLAAGAYVIEFEYTGNHGYLGRRPRRAVAESGKTTTLVLKVDRAVPIRGKVQDAETGEPVAGAKASLSLKDGFRALPLQPSNERGELTGWALPGSYTEWLTSPKGYRTVNPPPRRSAGMPPSVVIPEGAKEFELPVMTVVKQTSVQGKVVDSDNHPVAHAVVSADWSLRDSSQFRHIQTIADSKGEFGFDDLPTKSKIRLWAAKGSACTRAPVIHETDDSSLVELTISPKNAGLIEGKVLDDAGKPVPKARVALTGSLPSESDLTHFSSPVAFHGSGYLRTDANGVFRTPRPVPQFMLYKVAVTGNDFEAPLPVDARAVPAGSEDEEPLVIRVRHSGTVAGKIVDSRGKPIAGAQVTLICAGAESSRQQTDESGEYRLSGQLGATALLAARAKGFHANGQAVKIGATAPDLTLTPASEPAGPAMKTLAPPLSREQERELALELLDKSRARSWRHNDSFTKLEIPATLALDDPAAALADLGHAGDSPNSRDYLRRAAIVTLARDDIDDAAAVVEAIEKPHLRIHGYCYLVDIAPSDRKEQKLQWLGQALVVAKDLPSLDLRVHMMGLIGGRLYDLGDKEGATAVLREAQAAAKDLPTEGRESFARGPLAVGLGRIDLDGAIALLKDLEAVHIADMYCGRLAVYLASRDPAAAERMLEQFRQPHMRDAYAIRVCSGFPPSELARAERLAMTIKQLHFRAKAFLAIAESQPTAAAALANVDKAFDVLEKDVGHYRRLLVALSALPIVERHDATAVRSWLWRAMSYYPTEDFSQRNARGLEEVQKSTSSVAILVARYDRDLARVLLEAMLARLPLPEPKSHLDNAGCEFFAATALVDPAWAVSLLEKLPAPDETKSERENPGYQARKAIAIYLLLPPSERWKHAERPDLRMWYHDERFSPELL